ncbi:hypothetical protein [Streptomyces sp. NPDC056255]|uniref:hypothetical protein n=1 Tax=Streptomyces sp. NPDC056255 TaxID=3345764 RepID=UPI0035D956F6
MARGRGALRQVLGAVLAAARLIGDGAGTAAAVAGGTDAPVGVYPYMVSVREAAAGG